MWRLSGLRYMKGEWSELLEIRVDWGIWSISGLRHVEAEWIEVY